MDWFICLSPGVRKFICVSVRVINHHNGDKYSTQTNIQDNNAKSFKYTYIQTLRYTRWQVFIYFVNPEYFIPRKKEGRDEIKGFCGGESLTFKKISYTDFLNVYYEM